MAKRYLLLAALSALMLGACSDDNSVNGEPDVPQMQPNTLPMNVLSASSQAGRITVASATRGPKSERLQLVAKIDPLSDTGSKHWSATGIAVSGDKAYVTWHSNRQATTQATVWGGALDVINIPSPEVAGEWEFENTATSDELKFNHVYVNGENLYLAATSSEVGAAVGRVAIGRLNEVAYLDIPGSSANAVAASGSNLVAVSGYTGAAVSFPATFVPGTTEPTVLQAEAADFGGKYVEGGYILRSDSRNAYLIPVAGGEARMLDVPLVSEEKYAESFNNTTGQWTEMTGEEATYYGKHTMAVSGGYVYIAAGKNGLRSYALNATTPEAAWSNGTNTTAVYADDTYIYAATGAGLRVYTKGENGALNLFAFEVQEYDEAGKPASTAGTDGHSANFVAVDAVNGYIFVAYGQSGVYVFKLNPEVPEEKDNLSLSIPAIVHNESKEVDKGNSAEFTIPETIPDAPEGKEFAGWSEDPEDADSPVYQPGDKVTVTPENPNVELKPIWKDKEIEFTLTFDINKGTGVTPAPMTGKSTESTCTIENLPGADKFSKEGYDFLGWSTNPDATEPEYLPTEAITIDGNVTLYAVWKEVEKTTFKVTFDIETATGSAPTAWEYTGPEDEYTFPDDLPGQNGFDKEGFEFKGWAEIPLTQQGKNTVGLTGKYTVFKAKPNVTLYPVWSLKQTTGGTPGAGGDEL